MAKHAQHSVVPMTINEEDGSSVRMGTLQDVTNVCAGSQRYGEIHSLLLESPDLTTVLSTIINRDDSWEVVFTYNFAIVAIF